MSEYTLTITAHGFHGSEDYPVRGTNWRAWNESLIAVDLTDDAADEMWEPIVNYCRMPDCMCGGLVHMPAVVDTECTGPGHWGGTYLVPYNWISDTDREACAEIDAACRQCEAWLEERVA